MCLPLPRPAAGAWDFTVDPGRWTGGVWNTGLLDFDQEPGVVLLIVEDDEVGEHAFARRDRRYQALVPVPEVPTADDVEALRTALGAWPSEPEVDWESARYHDVCVVAFPSSPAHTWVAAFFAAEMPWLLDRGALSFCVPPPSLVWRPTGKVRIWYACRSVKPNGGPVRTAWAAGQSAAAATARLSASSCSNAASSPVTASSRRVRWRRCCAAYDFDPDEGEVDSIPLRDFLNLLADWRQVVVDAGGASGADAAPSVDPRPMGPAG